MEIKLAFAAIGGKQDDVPIKPIAHGATPTTLVAPEKAKERAKAKAKRERAKARKAKVKRAKVKEKDKVRVRKADLDQARPAAEHHRETVRRLAEDRLPRPKESAYPVCKGKMYQEPRRVPTHTQPHMPMA